MLSERSWVFAGILNVVKAWNTHMNTKMSLTGPAGLVYTMTMANEMIFAGTHDGRILIWKFNVKSNCFELMALLTSHTLPVVSIVVGTLRFYSGSMDNTIRKSALKLVQTLPSYTPSGGYMGPNDPSLMYLGWPPYSSSVLGGAGPYSRQLSGGSGYSWNIFSMHSPRLHLLAWHLHAATTI